MASALHTRRATIIWHITIGDYLQAIVRYDPSEPGNLEHRWRSTRDVQDVEHEVLGLIDAWMGFANGPKRE